MIIRVLGSAAGGGLPQWNCRATNSDLARRGSPLVRPRTQSSLAVSPDGTRWALLNASPDLGVQIARSPSLQPRHDGPLRNSPIEAVVLTNADVDHIGGLLTLRESHTFGLFADARVLEVLEANPIFDVLDRRLVRRTPLLLGKRAVLMQGTFDFPSLDVVPFVVPGKIALYLEDQSADQGLGSRDGDTIGLEVISGTGLFHYIPGCAEIDLRLQERLRGSRLVLFDGTLFSDQEMIDQGLSWKSGRRMGHVSMSGEGGSLSRLSGLDIARRIYVHLNNSNPVLREDSAERREIERLGWEIAYDGMELSL
jgi:pyrroloquinoline quinone biosynthesis protein B